MRLGAAGGLAAALGDAGFGNARGPRLPSVASPGGEHAMCCGQARPSIGDGCLSGSRDRAMDPGGPWRCSVRWGEHGYARRKWLRLRCWRRAGARAGRGERRKEPRLLASGAQVHPKGRPPTIKGVIAAITGRLRKWSNPRLGAAIREDCVLKDCVSVRAAYFSRYASTQEKGDGSETAVVECDADAVAQSVSRHCVRAG